MNNTFEIYKTLNSFDGILISESGIKNKDDVLKISNQTNIKTFLIGESLLKNLDSNSIFSQFFSQKPFIYKPFFGCISLRTFIEHRCT